MPKSVHISFTITHQDKNSQARVGKLVTKHGTAETPYFMAVATKGVGKCIGPDDYRDCTDGLIANALILSIRPGLEVIEEFGDIQAFMNYHKPMFTDCGAFQMLRESFLETTSKKGIHFKSPFDGKRFLLTPEKIMEIEQKLGADCVMMLDDVAPYNATREQYEKSLDNAIRWGELSKKYHTKKDQFLYGIVQGGYEMDLREKSAKWVCEMDFDGNAIGGVAIGETREEMFLAINASMPHLDPKKPKHLLGVGSPDDIVEAVGLGLDTFDSVYPTQAARHGTIFTFHGKIDILKAKHIRDKEPIEKGCDCFTCKNFSVGYIRHLLKLNEPVGKRYATIHSLRFMQRLMEKTRESIKNGTFEDFKNEIITVYRKNKHHATHTIGNSVTKGKR
ncbi:MAG: tRNA guanosine(34) transglycosylase Tgt [Candidatus Woesearchaeota archaeon]